MYIVVVGWIYVVLMMSIAEVSIVAGVMTFLLYGVLPVAIIMYLGGSRSRRRSRQQTAEQASTLSMPAPTSNPASASSAHQPEAEVNAPEHHEDTTK